MLHCWHTGCCMSVWRPRCLKPEVLLQDKKKGAEPNGKAGASKDAVSKAAKGGKAAAAAAAEPEKKPPKVRTAALSLMCS